jgi:hypothetical protein
MPICSVPRMPVSAGKQARPPHDNTGAVLLWTLATAALLGGLAWCRLRTVAVLYGAVLLALGMALLLANWRVNSTDWTGRRPSDRADVLVVLSACLALPSIVFVATAVGVLHSPDGAKLWVARAGLTTAAVGTSAIFLSALVDWSYTTPRRRGTRHGSRPCTDSGSERWRALTRNWLWHRIASFALVRLAAGTFVGIVIFGVFSDVPDPIVSVLTAAAALLAAYVVSRISPAATVSQNPPLRVGDAVTLAEEFGTGVHDQPIYYVVDVAVEGVQLRELHNGTPNGAVERSHDRVLEIKDINRLLRVREPYAGCLRRCQRVNKYCPLRLGEPT